MLGKNIGIINKKLKNKYEEITSKINCSFLDGNSNY